MWKGSWVMPHPFIHKLPSVSLPSGIECSCFHMWSWKQALWVPGKVFEDYGLLVASACWEWPVSPERPISGWEGPSNCLGSHDKWCTSGEPSACPYCHENSLCMDEVVLGGFSFAPPCLFLWDQSLPAGMLVLEDMFNSSFPMPMLQLPTPLCVGAVVLECLFQNPAFVWRNNGLITSLNMYLFWHHLSLGGMWWIWKDHAGVELLPVNSISLCWTTPLGSCDGQLGPWFWHLGSCRFL